jgi:hypothetical protein
MSCPGVRNLDSGPEHRFRQRRIGSRPLRNGRSTSPENTNPAPGSAANSRHCCTQAGYRSADTWNCQSQPWNRSQHHWLYAAIAERHARTKHNLAEVGDSWSNHSATRATGAQTVSHGSPTAPPSNYWNPGREVQCRQFRCSIRTIRNSCTSCRVTRTTCSTYAAELGF